MTTERRWSEGDAPPEVRRLLDSAVIDEPTAEQLASLDARMAGLLAAPPAPAPAPAAAGVGVAGKIVGAIALLAVGVGAGVWIGRTSERPPEVVTSVTKSELPSPQPSPPEGKGGLSAPTVVMAVPEPVVPVKPTLPIRRPVPEPVLEKPEVVEEDELTLLQSAMSAPTAEASLQLVERHLAKFPLSDLAQEREVLAIKALMRLERFDDARARAEQFKARWPTSPHALRVEALLKKVP